MYWAWITTLSLLGLPEPVIFDPKIPNSNFGMLGWKDFSLDKSTGYVSKGPEFKSSTPI